ncbi:transmembrane protein 181-like [Pelomyxa schiedti]|nr:transmembrane protein 181-like [Pelomyxa schiedti]
MRWKYKLLLFWEALTTVSNKTKPRVDRFKRWHLGLLLLVWAFSLMGGLLVGFLGPAPLLLTKWFAYECPRDSHVWSESCTGEQMAIPGSVWTKQMPEIKEANRFWGLSLQPYNRNYTDGRERSQELLVAVNMSYLPVPDSGVWHVRVENLIDEVYVHCSPDETQSACDLFTLIFQMPVVAPIWNVSVAFLNESNFIGDVAFEFSTGAIKFTYLEIIVTIFYLIVTFVALGFVVYHSKQFPLRDWSLEHKFIVVLQAALILYNNPLFTFKFLPFGGFFAFLNAFFKIGFLSLLCLYWLFCLDKLSKDHPIQKEFGFAAPVKIFLVVGFLVLGLTMYIYQSVVEVRDPVYGVSFDITGVLILFVLVVLMYMAIILWLVFISLLTIKDIYRNRLLLVRYLYLFLPTIVLMAYSIISIFTGSFIALGSSAVGLVFFYTLYNTYVPIMALGFLPLSPATPEVPGDEVASLLATPGSEDH